jgi:hypothetical protein
MRCVLTACILATATVAAAAGQDTRPTATTPQDKPVMISGCLEGGPSSYTLSTRPVTRLPHEPADIPIGTSGTSMTYNLTARDEVDLARHVGKKVEIRGSLLPARSAPTPAPSTKSEPRVKQDDSPDVKSGQGAGADSGATALVRPNLAVTSVRVVSVTCR